MYKIDRRGVTGEVQKSFSRNIPLFMFCFNLQTFKIDNTFFVDDFFLFSRFSIGLWLKYCKYCVLLLQTEYTVSIFSSDKTFLN